MKKKLTAILLCTLLIGSTFTINTLATSNSKQEKDKDSIIALAQEYVNFKQDFHRMPDDKVETETLDDTVIQSVVNDKKNDIKKFAKENTEFYKSNCEMVEVALNLQKVKDKDHPRSFGGYASDININSVTFSGNSAHIDMTFTGHATYGQWQDDKWILVNPSNVILQSFDFEKDSSGTWYIVSDDWSFAPGSEP